MSLYGRGSFLELAVWCLGYGAHFSEQLQSLWAGVVLAQSGEEGKFLPTIEETGSGTASLATPLIGLFGSSSQDKDGRTEDIRNKDNSHPSEKHSGCGSLLLVSNHMPLFHFWCPPAGAPFPGGPVGIHGQIQMPRCLTPYSPSLPSKRKKKR